MKHLYLAGPIEGCSDDEIHDWRTLVTDKLHRNIRAITPYRGEDKVDEKYSFETAKRIMTKNYMDVQSCDMVLAYMPKQINNRRPSYGTTFEVAWAYSLQKPILIVSDDEFLRNHPLMAVAGLHFSDIERALEYINPVLGAYE